MKQIRRRLGLPAAIIDDARSTLDPDELRAESLLDEIHHQRELARQAGTAADASREEAEHLRNELVRRLEKIEDERREILEKTRREAQSQVEELQEELRETRKSLARGRQPLDALKQIEAAAHELEERVETPVERTEPELDGRPSSSGSPGSPRTTKTQATAVGRKSISPHPGDPGHSDFAQRR